MRCGQHIMNFVCDRNRHFVRPGCEHQLRHLVGEIAGAEKPCQRGEQDKEWKHRHERGQRDMACDCPAVVGEETPVSIDGNIERSSHRSSAMPE
jgi:hypothetical protein